METKLTSEAILENQRTDAIIFIQESLKKLKHDYFNSRKRLQESLDDGTTIHVDMTKSLIVAHNKIIHALDVIAFYPNPLTVDAQTTKMMSLLQDVFTRVKPKRSTQTQRSKIVLFSKIHTELSMLMDQLETTCPDLIKLM